MDKIKEKTCSDCEHFKQHYGKIDGKFMKICCGHCTQKTNSGRFRKAERLCEDFIMTSTREKLIIKKESAGEKLSRIADLFSEIIVLFKD